MTAATEHPRSAVRIVVRGQVQGVGFRPFVYRLAQQCRLGGSVRNAADGVALELEGRADDLADFQSRLTTEAPPGAKIEDIAVESASVTGLAAFCIRPSDTNASLHVRLPPDVAICAECRRELLDPSDRRFGYPFINCTTCGPRYSIIRAMPYDRPATAMVGFAQCNSCHAEYRSPANRRFHAQPNACAACGPQVALWDHAGRQVAGAQEAVRASAALLRQGRIVAIKGLGGFQLLVAADQPGAISRLRRRKRRPTKPLAVMVPSFAAATRLAALDDVEQQLLLGPRNPIVIANQIHGNRACAAVAPYMKTVGMFLPTTPLHELLLTDLGFPVVATSGNRSEEPIVTEERDAVDRLSSIADAFLVHDRPIVRRVDDSVVRVIAGQPVTIRLARGYAPLPLPSLENPGQPPVLATGGHMKNALALWNGHQAILGQHVGDLDHAESRSAFEVVADDLCRLYDCKPAAIACDLHPDYFTTKWAAARHVPVVRVQHHHAHAVAAMAEHRLLDQEVLAVAWDGTGYGPDGTIWGGEFLRARRDGFNRVGSLLPFPLPGGEAAIRHPKRIALGLLHVLFGLDAVLAEPRWLKRLDLGAAEARVLASMIQRGVQTPWTSSVGRLFDGVAALVLPIHEVSYEGEAAVRLEALADPATDSSYTLAPVASGKLSISSGDWRPLLAQVLADLDGGHDTGWIAARFHNALAHWAGQVVARAAIPDVVLTGGCFQNRMLTERTAAAIQSQGFRVYTPGLIPPGDGGLAVGQLAVAMAARPSTLW